MEEKKPLFDKPMDELREAFVRNRFGQTDVFGLVEIETWLQYQRTVERPDEVMWQSFLTRDFLEMCAATAPLTHLHERATRQHALRGEGDRYWRLLFQLPDGLYFGHQHVGAFAPVDTNELFVLDRDERGRLTVEYVSNANSYVGARAVVTILFAEWDNQRPKWSEAREFLCDALDEEIRRERAKTEHDFDTAVAVSADGTKIVHADWVVVTGLGTVTHGHPGLGLAAVKERLRVFPSSAFRDRKILRTERYIRIDPYVPNDSFPLRNDFPTLPVESQIARVLSRAEHPSLIDSVRSEERQMFVRLNVLFGLENVEPTRWKIDLRTTVLITDVRHCPSPLPEGGVEVAV